MVRKTEVSEKNVCPSEFSCRCVFLQTRTLQTRKFRECEGYTIYCYYQSVSDYFFLFLILLLLHMSDYIQKKILACNFRTRKVIFTEKIENFQELSPVKWLFLMYYVYKNYVNLSISIPAFQKKLSNTFTHHSMVFYRPKLCRP